GVQYQHMIATLSDRPFSEPYLQALRASEEVFTVFKSTRTPNDRGFWNYYKDMTELLYVPDRNIPTSFQQNVFVSANCFMIGSSFVLKAVELAGYLES